VNLLISLCFPTKQKEKVKTTVPKNNGIHIAK
jgi:hypothetical protein